MIALIFFLSLHLSKAVAQRSLKHTSDFDSRVLETLNKMAFENIVGKGENAGDQHFLLFPKYFLPYQKQFHYFSLIEFDRQPLLLIW